MTAAPTINGKTQAQWKRVYASFQRATTVAAALRAVQAECQRVVLVYTAGEGWLIEASDAPDCDAGTITWLCEDLMIGLQRYLDGLANHAPYAELAEAQETEGAVVH